MVLSLKYPVVLLAPMVVLGACGCSKSGQGVPNIVKAENHSVLTDVEQRGNDTYADLQVQREWIEQRRVIPVDLPVGRTIQVKLNPVMEDGTSLRLKGQAFQGNGDLLVRICIAK